MPISGLVVTLSEDPAERANAIAVLSRDARLELGEPTGARLPVVAETASAQAAEDLFRSLFDVSGVAFVDVVSVDVSLDEEV
jgi:hypothetical protein